MTGKLEETAYLEGIGAAQVIDRETLLKGNDRPMLKPTWAGVVDCVGGDILAAAIKSAKYDGVVTCCGLVASIDLPINVFPFILRGVRLIGIDSAECPMERRIQVWQRMANELKLDNLAGMVDEITLDGLEEKVQLMLKGGMKRRALVNLLKS